MEGLRGEAFLPFDRRGEEDMGSSAETFLGCGAPGTAETALP